MGTGPPCPPPPPNFGPLPLFPKCPQVHTYLSSSLSWATPMPNMDRAKLKRAALKGSEVLRLGLASRRMGGAGDEGRERDSLGRAWQGDKELSLALSSRCQESEGALSSSGLPSGPRRGLHPPAPPQGCQTRLAAVLKRGTGSTGASCTKRRGQPGKDKALLSALASANRDGFLGRGEAAC